MGNFGSGGAAFSFGKLGPGGIGGMIPFSPKIRVKIVWQGLFGGAVLIIIRRGSVLGLPCILDFRIFWISVGG